LLVAELTIKVHAYTFVSLDALSERDRPGNPFSGAWFDVAVNVIVITEEQPQLIRIVQ
jgi:hypothetical protein